MACLVAVSSSCPLVLTRANSCLSSGLCQVGAVQSLSSGSEVFTSGSKWLAGWRTSDLPLTRDRCACPSLSVPCSRLRAFRAAA
jgi:hypothetical protein